MRLGLFGGTFDPPHVGHLLVAMDASESLELDRLVFIPAASQPFKQDTVHATPEQRMTMLRLMIGGDPRFDVDPVEIDRGGLSFTIDTLEVFARRHPEATRYLLIGEDLAGQIGSWRDPHRLARLARIVVLTRGESEGEEPGTGISLQRLATRRVDVSSTEIRERCARGRSIAGFVTDAVADYIRTAGLYR